MANLKQWQLGLLHTVPAALGIPEDCRQMIQRNLTGHWSAAEMDFADLAIVLGHYEQRYGWVDRRHGRGFWSGLAARAELLPLEGKVMKLAEVLGWTDELGKVDFARLGGFVRRMTGGRCRGLRDCEREDLMVLVEALKVLGERGERGDMEAEHAQVG